MSRPKEDTRRANDPRIIHTLLYLGCATKAREGRIAVQTIKAVCAMLCASTYVCPVSQRRCESKFKSSFSAREHLQSLEHANQGSSRADRVLANTWPGNGRACYSILALCFNKVLLNRSRLIQVPGVFGVSSTVLVAHLGLTQIITRRIPKANESSELVTHCPRNVPTVCSGFEIREAACCCADSLLRPRRGLLLGRLTVFWLLAKRHIH